MRRKAAVATAVMDARKLAAPCREVSERRIDFFLQFCSSLSPSLAVIEEFLHWLRQPHAKAINCDDGDRAARTIRHALGIESDEVVNYCFPKSWPADCEQRAPIIGDWLQTEARYLA